MVWDQTLAPQKLVGVINGGQLGTTAKIGLVVATGVTATTDVTLEVNGVNITLGAWTALGTDIPAASSSHPFYGSSACSVYIHTIIGLNPFPQENPYTVFVNGVADTVGNIMAQALPDDPVAVMIGTCANMYMTMRSGPGAANRLPQEPLASGGFKHIREYAESGALPVGAMFTIDDVIYADTTYIDDRGGAGHYFTDSDNPNWEGPQGTKLSYDFCLAWMNMLGMFEDAKDQTYGGQEQWWGRNADRLWCFANLPCFVQRGDHEFTDDFGNAYGKDRTQPDGDLWAAASEFWDAVMVPMQGQSLQSASGGGGDANAGHWSVTIGCNQFVSADCVYNAVANAGASSPNNPVAHVLDSDPATSSQVSDLLKGLDTQDPFHTLLWPLQYRKLSNTAAAGREPQGMSWAFKSMNLDEFERLFTKTGEPNKSIMDNNWLNGMLGQCDLICGDYHAAAAFHYHNVASGGDAPESLCVFYAGTLTGSTNFAIQKYFTVGDRETEKVNILYLPVAWAGLATSFTTTVGFSVMRMELYPNEVYKRKVVTIVNGKGDENYTEEEYSREFVGRITGNEGQVKGEIDFTETRTTAIVGVDNGST